MRSPAANSPFEFMLNALRLKGGFELARFTERTGLALSALEPGLCEAERRGLVERDLRRVWPTERGFDLLSDLQALFLPALPARRIEATTPSTGPGQTRS